MRKVFLILMFFSFLLGCKEKEYSLDDLEIRNGISYLKGTMEPYTGETVERLGKQIAAVNIFEDGDHISGTTFYPNGNKEYEIETKNGKENGYWRQYFYNGQLNYETYKIDGNRNGITRSYYENGQLEFEYKYINDNLIGSAISYYEDGQIRTKRDSLENGFTYYKDGKIRSRVENGKGEIFYNKKGEEVLYEEI